ncbi:hypothetical protein L226DRAFT_314833 [Lentinus tigrinus ALCF2SS1-7]|uniref:uncharacterized protein n=1 Tax=Lentinus tigrinus ALCF2SS1-7 TaxID=1328758 RepID=UPI001165DD22|nr:hypothetical protein L226DRAFT_314833 [Lentinus tigrinus ALCF2SS1-7]
MGHDASHVGTQCRCMRSNLEQYRSILIKWSEKMEKLDESFAQDDDDDGASKQVYPERSMKWWWAKANLRSIDSLPSSYCPRHGRGTEGHCASWRSPRTSERWYGRRVGEQNSEGDDEGIASSRE